MSNSIELYAKVQSILCKDNKKIVTSRTNVTTFILRIALLCFCLWSYQLIAFTMNVDDFNGGIIFQMLTQLCNVHIH